MRLRAFNPDGINAFRDYLRKARNDATAPVPTGLLEQPSLTTPVDPAIEVEPRRFPLRIDAARYLSERLKPFKEHRIKNDAGLWTWLTLFYFDEVCPAVAGQRSVKNDYTYVFEPRNARHFYRHLLFLAWYIITLSPRHNRLFLRVPVSTLDKASEEVFKRLYLTRIPCLFEVLDRLYWDETRQRARRGIVDARRVEAGDLYHRFPAAIRQLERTYDLISLSADQLIELLGPEFSTFRSEPVATD
jgi:hypothetical protein